MKRYWKLAAVLILLVFGAAASESVMARGGHGGSGRGGSGHVGGYGHGGGYSHGYSYRDVGVAVALGVPLYGLGYYSSYYPYPYGYPAPPYAYPAPAYAYPPYAYPGPAIVPSGAYIEQGYAQAAPAPAQPQDWYFCADSKAYYPYVRECPGGWQRVPSQPPR